MAKKKWQDMFKRIRTSLAPLQASERDDYRFNFGPTLEPYSTERHQMAQTYVTSRRRSDDPVPSDDEVDRINKNRLEQAKLSQAYEGMAQAREALNLTLRSQHRLLIATLLAALVALIVGVISLFDKPPVVNIAPPAVNVQPPDIKVNVIPQ